MTRTFLIGGLLALAASGSAVAADHAIVQPRVQPPDNVTRPSLVNFINATPSPTIVLRVPAARAAVTQTQGTQGSPDLNRAFLAIERELVKAGFTVRDRGLLEEILRSNQSLDYKLIEQKIDAQLILEIVSIAPKSYATAEYVDAKRREHRTLEKGMFAIDGWRFESRVILVNSGEIGGIYSADVVPQDLHFQVSGKRIYNADVQGRPDTNHSGYAFGPAEEAAPLFMQALLSALKPALARMPLGVSTVALTPTARKQLGFKLPKSANGALVTSVTRGSRAMEAGIEAGDLIVAIDGRRIDAPDDVPAATTAAGTKPMRVVVNRGGKERTLAVPAP